MPLWEIIPNGQDVRHWADAVLVTLATDDRIDLGIIEADSSDFSYYTEWSLLVRVVSE